MRNFKKVVCIILMVTFVLGVFSGCGKKEGGVNKKAISKELGIDITAAEERYNNDFTEDSGNTLITIVYKDNALENLIKNAEHWNKLPMDAAFREFLTTTIPDAEEGYYYFCNKNKNVDDVYDPSVINEDEKNILYYIEVN